METTMLQTILIFLVVFIMLVVFYLRDTSDSTEMDTTKTEPELDRQILSTTHYLLEASIIKKVYVKHFLRCTKLKLCTQTKPQKYKAVKSNHKTAPKPVTKLHLIS